MLADAARAGRRRAGRRRGPRARPTARGGATWCAEAVARGGRAHRSHRAGRTARPHRPASTAHPGRSVPCLPSTRPVTTRSGGPTPRGSAVGAAARDRRDLPTGRVAGRRRRDGGRSGPARAAPPIRPRPRGETCHGTRCPGVPAAGGVRVSLLRPTGEGQAPCHHATYGWSRGSTPSGARSLSPRRAPSPATGVPSSLAISWARSSTAAATRRSMSRYGPSSLR